jgi:hypothetical protein
MTRVPYITIVLWFVLAAATGCSQGGGESAGEVVHEKTSNAAPAVEAVSRTSDSDVEFIRKVCIQGFEHETEMPAEEVGKFCDCVRDEIAIRITAEHRAAIQSARGYLALDRAPPADVFEKSGLKALVEASQDRCASQLWPEPQAISEEEHAGFSALANQSVAEFSAILDEACDDLAPGKKREACLKSAAQSWMDSHSAPYETIPDYYITGNDLAQEFLAN